MEPDYFLEAILVDKTPEYVTSTDPMQQESELKAPEYATSIDPMQQKSEMKTLTAAEQPGHKLNILSDTLNKDNEQGGIDIPIIEAQPNQALPPHGEQLDKGEFSDHSLFDLAAPPGFPTPKYLDANQNLLVGFLHLPSELLDPVIMEKERTDHNSITSSDATLLGQEGVKIWKNHFAPNKNNKQVIRALLSGSISISGSTISR